MSRTGTITYEEGMAVISFRRRMPYPIESVWQAITDPSERAAWFGETTIDARVGGAIESIPAEPPAAVESKRMTGRILAWEPPRVFEHEAHQRIVEPGVVRWELEPDGDDATYVTYIHRGLTEQNATGFVPGSHAFLDRLEAHLGREPIPGWQARYEEVASLYA
jgi:uncharacterized protein YndB with AHSA1/START domain